MADGPTARQRAAINCVETLDITRPDVRKFIPARFVPGSAIDADGKRRIEFWLRVVFSALIDANRLDLSKGNPHHPRSGAR
jgi:CRISPR-associated endonuclease/helicase Cas3